MSNNNKNSAYPKGGEESQKEKAEGLPIPNIEPRTIRAAEPEKNIE